MRVFETQGVQHVRCVYSKGKCNHIIRAIVQMTVIFTPWAPKQYSCDELPVFRWQVNANSNCDR